MEKFKDEYKKGKTEEKKRVFDLKKYYEAIKKYVEEYSVFAKSKVELDTKGGELTIIITNSNDKNQYMVIYNNKRIKYSISENKSYMGKILDTSLSLEKWKVKFDSKNIKNDFSFLELCVVRAKKQLIGELGDSEDQGKKVYPSGDYVNVRSGPYADTKGANQNLIYKHDNKKKSIGIYLMKQLTKGKGDIKDWNWYKIQFPEKIKGWETGWVREDTVELK